MTLTAPAATTDGSKFPTVKTTNLQLHTPPSSPIEFEKYYTHFNIQLQHSDLMPQPSKIKTKEPFSWSEINFIIKTNKLEIFARSKEQTIKYHNFKQWLKDNKILVNDYLLGHELHWKESEIRDQEHVIVPQEYSVEYPQDLIFHNPDDITILYNKFPYYFDTNVKHLCIWTKLRIPVDRDSACGDISDRTKKIIHRYLEKTFVEKGGLSWDQIVWFKNWLTLQSVRAISHIHVILRDVDDVFIEQLIGGPGEVLTLDDYRNL
ncbi:N-acetylglucosamine-induced protein 1 [Candida viswanathii]|uniref:N-acetylglucosamine-induced protein 1 n=1 Tax=Candida viswanathii TaxID=5486 RepID=A0A367Y5E8_9ASCO|nr:N-acetylglucosamine-induced protein 1 [Candida viswanathii]